MPLDINGYNDTFKAFVDFAQEKMSAKEKEAVERHTREEHQDLVDKWTAEYDHQFPAFR